MKKKESMLFTPGPVIFSSSVRKSLAGPSLHHRSSDFQNILKSVSKKLKTLFQTVQPVLTLNSSGTGAMEAAVVNTCSPGDEALFLSAGKFGERWSAMGKSFGLRANILKARYGETFSPKEIERFLQRRPQTKALFVQAVETSTGTAHPITALSKILKKFPQTLFIVDGSTAAGAVSLKMDLQSIDVLIGASQKSAGLPAGMAFIALSEKAWKRQAAARCPKYYFDLLKERHALERGETAFSANTAFLRALDESALPASSKVLQMHIARIQALAHSTAAFCKAMGLKLFSSAPAASVTAVCLPEKNGSTDSWKKLNDGLRLRHGFVFAGGQGPLKGRIFRIGHLGPIHKSLHLRALKALAQELRRIYGARRFSAQKCKDALRAASKELRAAS